MPRALKRLRRDLGDGTEYLFNIVEHHAPPLGINLEAVLHDSLTARRPRVAIAAASLISLSGLGARLRTSLFAAIEHWTANPPAKPRFGDPPDPRREMAKTLAKCTVLTDSELAGLIRYREGDVREVLSRRWQEASSFRTLLFERAAAGDLSAYELSALLETPVVLDANQHAMAMRLAASDDPRMRRAILKLFGWPGFLNAKTRPVLEALAADSEREIMAVSSALLTKFSQTSGPLIR